MCNFGLGAIDSPNDLRDYDYSMLNNIDEEIEIPESFKLDYDIPIQSPTTTIEFATDEEVEQAIQTIIDLYEERGN